MAMKKKFLGLAMAAMVALPATGVYAATITPTQNGDRQVLEMSEGESSPVTVPVLGSVTNKNGLIANRIEVELPSKMAFVVHADGSLTDTFYNINNNSAEANIEVFVESFTGGKKGLQGGAATGIEVLSKSEFDTKEQQKELYRNQIKLGLSNENGSETVDLGGVDSLSSADKKIATIQSRQSAKLKLSGEAGSKTQDTQGSSVAIEEHGASDNFELKFLIKKVVTP